jgi:hypothetical protein
MNNYPKIKQASALQPYIIDVLFDNNQRKLYDFAKLLIDNNFTKLKDYNYFKNLKVSSGGYGIEWDDEIDLSEAELWLNGK